MKSKSLLVYGYVLPIIGSALVAGIPMAFGLSAYEAIVDAFRQNLALAFAVIALAVALAIPFQTKILWEDHPVVLKVLESTGVREVFCRASAYQASIIMLIGLVLLVGSLALPCTPYVGMLLLFCASLVGFEALAMVTNGRAYGQLREKIITRTSGSQGNEGDENNTIDPRLS